MPCEIFDSISPYLKSETHVKFLTRDRHSVETVAMSKYVAKYKQCKNRLSNFSVRFSIVELKLPVVIRLALQNINSLQ